MIEETARHYGHLDLLRERANGRVEAITKLAVRCAVRRCLLNVAIDRRGAVDRRYGPIRHCMTSRRYPPNLCYGLNSDCSFFLLRREPLSPRGADGGRCAPRTDSPPFAGSLCSSCRRCYLKGLRPVHSSSRDRCRTLSISGRSVAGSRLGGVPFAPFVIRARVHRQAVLTQDGMKPRRSATRTAVRRRPERRLCWHGPPGIVRVASITFASSSAASPPFARVCRVPGAMCQDWMCRWMRPIQCGHGTDRAAAARGVR